MVPALQHVPKVPCTKVNCTVINKVPFFILFLFFYLIITSYTTRHTVCSARLCSRREEPAARRSRRGQSSTSAAQGGDTGPTAVLGVLRLSTGCCHPGAPRARQPRACLTCSIQPLELLFLCVHNVVFFLQSLRGPQHTETFSKCFKKCH